MRWIFIVLLMCNGIYFLWQNYLVQGAVPVEQTRLKQADASVPALKLLKELPSSELSAPAPVAKAGVPERPETEPEAKSPVVPEPVEQICWQIGPFKEEVSGKLVVGRLEALDIHLQLYPVEIADKPDYWVHIPPRVSRREALKLLKELQIKNIDSFLITEGELENGISLGFFTQPERAEKVLEQRIKQGYEAKIKRVPRTHTELWAVFNEGEYGKFSDALWDKITEGNQGLERRKNYCDKIASTGNFD